MAEEENDSANEQGQEDASLADEWESMVAGGDNDANGGGQDEERVLNQDEIDLLLGFDSKSHNDDPNTGLHAILGKSHMAYEKLPMLEIVFDRMSRVLSTSMRNFTSDNVDVSIDYMTSLRFDEYVNTITLPALIVVYRAVEWENFGLITVDSSLIYSIVDVLLGGRRVHKSIRVEGRPYTTIEQDIVRSMVDLVLADMSQAFDPVSPISFQYERLETNPRFATITRPNNAALLVRLRVDMDDRGGVIEILLPHETLEPVRELLSQVFIGEKFGQDSTWERHMGYELKHAKVPVQALLDEKEITLKDLIDLKVGSTVLFDKNPEDDIYVKSGEVTMGRAKLGRVGDKMAISLLDRLQTHVE